jgi:hypothetical protein
MHDRLAGQPSIENVSPMKFAIMTQVGVHQYDLSADTTIGQLKDSIRRTLSIPPVDTVHLTYHARYLSDADSVSKVGLPEGGTLIMIVKPKAL